MFPESEEDNIYRSYVSHEREIVFFFFFCGKQPIKNKPYFYKSFSLTRDNFSLTLFFFFLFILPNTKKRGKLFL